MPVATTEVIGVNAVHDGDDAVLVMLRPGDSLHWQWFRLGRDDAARLGEQLRELTSTG